MEIEREKRDKLASARRKLNEYKQSRSSSKTAPAVSSKPADVPLFYQNINNSPPTQNFFNPVGSSTAASDNNNVTPPTYSFFTPSPVTQAETISSNVAQANYAPPPPLASAFTPPQQNFFTPIQTQHQQQQQQNEFQSPVVSFFDPVPPQNSSSESAPPTSTFSISSTLEANTATATSAPTATEQSPKRSNSITNPFAMPLPTDESTLLSAFSTADGGGNGRANESFFTPPNPKSESQDQDHSQPFSFFNPIPTTPASQTISDQGIEMPNASTFTTAPFEIKLNSEEDPEAGEFLPSAPPVESSVNLRNEPDLENQNPCTEEGPETDIPSNRSVKTDNSENTDPEVQQAFSEQESSDPNNPPVNMFTSSIFGSSSANSTALDDVFNVSSGTTSKTFEMLSVSPLEEEARKQQETMPSIFNPLTATASNAHNDYHDQELPVFEVIEKSDLLTAAVQNDSIQQVLHEPNPVIPVDKTRMEVGVGAIDSSGISESAISSTTPGTPAKQIIFGGTTGISESFGVGGSERLLPNPNSNVNTQTETKKDVWTEAMSIPQQPQHQDDRFSEAIQQMKSVQDALELQMEELQRENNYLLNRQTELTLKIEESERLAHEFKLEKDRVKEESQTTSQALRAKINSLCEENQRIVKNSTDIGVDLRAKLEEKSRQLEEMQKAAIILSQSKMDFASRLDHEEERVKELQKILRERDEEIVRLNSVNADLQDKLKQEQQKDAIIHQLQDQARHYQVQTETLHRELEPLRHKLKTSSSPRPPPPVTSEQRQPQHPVEGQHQHLVEGQQQQPTVHGQGPHSPGHEHDSHSHDHGDEHQMEREAGQSESNSRPHEHSDSCGHQDHDHSHDDHHHSHSDNESHHHSHDHSLGESHHHSHSHDHGECESHHSHDHGDHDHHHHDHSHEDHDHHHHHHHEEEHEHAAKKVRGPTDELTELKKTLHRLQWENSSFRNELDVLAVDAKQKRTYEEKCLILQEENERLKKNVEQLEHVIIQLQGENDTIGDYITLYQSQKLALRECAKEKDAQLEQLAREREMLLHRLAELTALVQDLKESKSEAGSQCADDHVHDHDHVHMEQSPPLLAPRSNKHQIEGKIRDLLTEISSSTLIENFHPCAVCSGRLMTV